jgi:hypothetical protein
VGFAILMAMETQHPTSPPQEFSQMNHTAMIDYLATEISTLSTNIMIFRSRVTFSISAGPFFLFGSIILLASQKNLSFGLDPTWGWKWKAVVVALLILATLCTCAGYILLGFVSGRLEQGALDKCNQWRSCIIRLQDGNQLMNSELEMLILDKPTWKAANVYMCSFAVIFLTFLATICLAITLVHKAG